MSTGCAVRNPTTPQCGSAWNTLKEAQTCFISAPTSSHEPSHSAVLASGSGAVARRIGLPPAAGVPVGALALGFWRLPLLRFLLLQLLA